MTPMQSELRGPWSSPKARTEPLGAPATAPPRLHTSHWTLSSGSPQHPGAGALATILWPGPRERIAPQPPADVPGPKLTVPAGGGQDTRTPSCGRRVCKPLALDGLAASPLALPEPGISIRTPVTMGPRWEHTEHVLRAGAGTQNSDLSLPPGNSVCLRQVLPPGLGA